MSPLQQSLAQIINALDSLQDQLIDIKRFAKQRLDQSIKEQQEVSKEEVK